MFVYNDGNYSTGTLSFQTTGSPPLLDAWTGEETPIIEYSAKGGSIVLSVSLQSTETRIFKFSKLMNQQVPKTHIVSSSDSVLGYTIGSGSVWVKVMTSEAAGNVSLSSGNTLPLHADILSPFDLDEWSVVVEQWLPPDNLYDYETQAKSNITLSVPGST